MEKLLRVFIVLVITIMASCHNGNNQKFISKADETLNIIFSLYDAGHGFLFHETYPYREDGRVSYLAGEDTLKGRRVAYLWPTSGLFTAVNALLNATEDKKYEETLRQGIIPGLQNYFDSLRIPPGYQSYVNTAPPSDRFYDDNVWIALDYLEAYHLTGDENYLDRSLLLWEFIISGWDEKANGGIYWCEQLKRSKNTCSNAPATVLAIKLFETTGNVTYFNWGVKIYDWTREYLQDPDDYLYFDKIDIYGRLDKRKFTYNSGQMLQASVLLYNVTGKEEYLIEAQRIADSGINYFTEIFRTPEGGHIRLFRRTDNWFNAVMMRGYVELYKVDANPKYLKIFQDNLDHLWLHIRDENGLFTKDWSGNTTDDYKWLLDQASIVEMFASLSRFTLN